MTLRVPQRLFLSYLSLILVTVVPLSLGAHLLLRRHLTELVESDLRRELLVGRALYDASPGLAADSVADLIGSLTGRRVTIVATDGEVLGESTLDGAELRAMTNHRGREEVQAALRGGVARSERLSPTKGVQSLYAATRSARGEVVRLAVPLEQVDRALGRVQQGILGVAGAALLMAAIFSFGFTVAITRPLRRVQAAAMALASGDLAVRLRERRTDEFGQVAAALDSLADELQRRLAQLEEEQAQTQALIDAMSEGVLALAPSGEIRRANPAARRIFGLSSRLAAVAPEAVSRRPDFLRVVRRVLGGETVHLTELTGEGRSLLATAHPLPDGGAVLVFLDITELRRLEGARRDFVANASHELKTPLTAIRGYSETLLEPDLPPELVHRFAETVKTNADRLQRIVDDLLDLSRIESGGWVVHPEEVRVAEVAREAWASQSVPFARKQIRLELAIDPAAAIAHCDPAALHQILCNLFSNALRYTPDGGVVTVRARPDGRDWVSIAVADNGAGIPTSHLPRIFERFYRVDPARARAEGGTGLGLAIVKHLVEAHGGQVEADSTLGQGTTIRFSLRNRH